jgi:hypothetical protein
VAHGGLDLTDRIGEPERLLLGRAEDVKGEPLSGALPDAGQASELCDEPVDGGGEQVDLEASAGIGAYNSGIGLP